MNRHERRAQESRPTPALDRAKKATWKIFAGLVATTVGFKTELHDAAIQVSRSGDDEDEKRFWELLEELHNEHPEKSDLLLKRLQHVDRNRAQVVRRYVSQGRV